MKNTKNKVILSYGCARTYSLQRMMRIRACAKRYCYKSESESQSESKSKFPLQIQLLHCIKQFTGDGGETLLRDGFAAALKLQEMNPKYYDTLVQTMVDFVDVGVEDGDKFDSNWRAPVIELVQ